MSSFEIAKHYEMFGDPDTGVIKMREVEVVVRADQMNRWNSLTGSLNLVASEHHRVPSDAYQEWKEEVEASLVRYRRAVLDLEKKLEILPGNIEIVREQS